ncbi:MAG: hypothetical protein P8Z68_06900, partial [Kineosporiaceae bacterium]
MLVIPRPRHRVRGLLAGLARTCLTVLRAAPGTALAAPSPVAQPPDDLCTESLSSVVGDEVTGPTPLPAPASDTGGALLSGPGVHTDLPEGAAGPPNVHATAWL